ncbi:uncharacterized protein LOC108104514 [Drosophila eugracilis]|uniref:uncharacterized protein LOC108104514 n=1 Tax=Drosophila eugracilis TaxID=29029 RepID=UPI0007E5D1E6|nr:uncharacterized protein LOC108104514 [Drosophila eugracilis]
MGRSKMNCSKRSRPFCHVSKATSISGHSIRMLRNGGNGRNPFFRFLAHFRKCLIDLVCHLPSDEVTQMASKIWNSMSPAEKKPFVAAARNYSYTFRSRSKKVNWLLQKLREFAAAEECQAQSLWLLMNGINYWQNCVLDDLLNLD